MPDPTPFPTEPSISKGKKYRDFDIGIRRLSGHKYEVYVSRSPSGEAKEVFKIPYRINDLERQMDKIEIALGRGRLRQLCSEDEKPVQDFGKKLFDSLFAGDIRSRYDESIHEVEQQGMGLRIRLHIDPPELAYLPWEFLFDQRRGDYISLSVNTPIVRYLELPQTVRPITIKPPIRILGMVASPKDLPELDVEREQSLVTQAIEPLQERGILELKWVPGQTWRHLQDILREGPWHIFHFIGHGGFDENIDQGVIALTADNGGTFRLPALQLARHLGDHTPLRLVVLNACLGARGSQRDIFSSTSSILIQHKIPAVLAMQYEISDKAAIEFSRTFYESIADGYPVDSAVAEARKAVSTAFIRSVEWGTPVLHLRSPDGILFRIEPAIPAKKPPSVEDEKIEPAIPVTPFGEDEKIEPAIKRPPSVKHKKIKPATKKPPSVKEEEILAPEVEKRDFIEDATTDPIQEILYQARVIQKNNPQDVDNFYKKSLEQYPNNAVITGDYALFLQDIRNDYDNAQKYFKKALKSDPDNAINNGNYALFLQNIRNDYDTADTYYRKVLELEPDNAVNTGNYALFLEEIKNDPDNAEKYYHKALQIDPDNAINAGNYAIFLKDIRGDNKNAEIYFKKALDLNLNNATIFGHYASFLRNDKKDYDGAETYYKKALELDPNNAFVCRGYASFLKNIRKDTVNAKKYYKIAKELDSNGAITADNTAPSVSRIESDLDTGILSTPPIIEEKPATPRKKITKPKIPDDSLRYIEKEEMFTENIPWGILLTNVDKQMIVIGGRTLGLLDAKEKFLLNSILLQDPCVCGNYFVSFDLILNRAIILGCGPDILIYDNFMRKVLFTLKGHKDQILAVDSGRNLMSGNIILAGSKDKTASIWTYKRVPSITNPHKWDPPLFLMDHPSSVNCVALEPIGSRTLITGSGKSAFVWDIYGRLLHTLDRHSDLVTSVLYGPPSDKSIYTGVTGSLDGSIFLWNLSNGKIVSDMKLEGNRIRSLAFSKDSKILAAGTDNAIVLIDWKKEKIVANLVAHTKPVDSLVCTFDEKYLISGSRDGTIKIWSMPGLLMSL